jgi:S-DNA-T family DNA segregation ATPase FtsK/SpoIIIE
MAQATKKKSAASSNSKKAGAKQAASAKAGKAPFRREIGAVICLLLGIFSLIGYFNGSGVFIGFFCGLIKGLVGWGYYATPPLLFLSAVILTFHRGRPVSFRVSCTLILSVVIGALLHLFLSKTTYEISLKMFEELWINGKALESGGVIGGLLTEMFTYLFSKTGAAIVLFCFMIFLLLSSLNKTIAGIVDAYRNRERREYELQPEPAPPVRGAEPARGYEPARPQESMSKGRKKFIDIPVDEPEVKNAAVDLPLDKKSSLFNSSPRVLTPDQILAGDENAQRRAGQGGKADQDDKTEQAADIPLDIPFMERRGERSAAPAQASTAETGASSPVPAMSEPPKTAVRLDPPKSTYVFPPLDLLAANTSGRVDGTEEVKLNSERLEAAFKSFGVSVKVSGFTRGPTVTRYEAELDAGVKLNRLTSLADDIALSLGASGVRIAAMPNKISTVGIEVPNKLVSKVHLRDIIDSQEFKGASSKLTFAIGKNIGGEAIVGNISKLPHMLVAGTTGSGKSVCLNSLILSILYKAAPEDVRFIMIDPKMVEFRVYNGIPHLLVPVVTDVKKAAGALQWAVVEMMKRYRMFSETNARDLEGYNMVMHQTQGEPLPQIVVVIDELADLMMTAAKEVEESVCRVAQMGRAAGVHLVIATQSPRADVITGLMKANIPSRIALKVSSSLESRIILDAGGNADKLVGNGDMLFAPIGAAKPIRIQGTWVSDEEREKVVDFVKKSGETQYSEEVMGEIEKAAEERGSDSKNGNNAEADSGADYDELLPQAVDIIFESGQASVSMLQRRLKLGYSRAARIVDQMEQMKIVGPFEGSKPRQLLITKQQWREMQYANGTAPADTYLPENDDYFEPEDDNPPA